ncbi:hypothetical protein M9H77_15609 [Catharanthus roseus]|uniref:Uncharacterized protein n=1 Tax=Catharanthus roseus TaxID=4058 RepID=A0ACC0AYC1_CATRO|nr:hypothetical protein M9H77_15609 [Catharanthus roseus]
MATMSFVESLKPRRISSFIATLALFIVLFVIDVDGFQLQYSDLHDVNGYFGHSDEYSSMAFKDDFKSAANSVSHRKLLQQGDTAKEVEQPNRIWGDRSCSSDIVIIQGPTTPMPNGIPVYAVEITNACIAPGCSASAIHLHCGWFSSARLINPHIFKRLQFDDCLVNDGNPLRSGQSIAFKYANTFPYQLSIASANC